MKHHAAPIIVAILLLLPVLYVGSYLALVRAVKRGEGAYSFQCHPLLRPIFSPLYRLDIELRPDAWWIREDEESYVPPGS